MAVVAGDARHRYEKYTFPSRDGVIEKEYDPTGADTVAK